MHACSTLYMDLLKYHSFSHKLLNLFFFLLFLLVAKLNPEFNGNRIVNAIVGEF